MKKLSTGAILLLILAIIAVLLVSGYNRLVGLDEGVASAWAQVENVYQRRADLIPNLVATVKGAAKFEQETLEKVIQARARATQTVVQGVPNADQLTAFQNSQDALSSALSRLMVVVERYPQLKATEAFRDLQRQLEGTENRIAVERRRYNEAARAFNTARRRFPTSLIAGWFGFDERPYFKANEGSERPPTVDFGAAPPPATNG